MSDFTNQSILIQRLMPTTMHEQITNVLLVIKNLLLFTPTYEFAFVDVFPYLFHVHNYLFWVSNQIHHVLPPFLVSLMLLSLFSFYHLRLNFFTRQPSFEWSRSFLFEKSRKAQTRDV